MHSQSFSWVWLFGTLWSVSHQAPLSMRFSWSGLPFLPPGGLPDSGIEATSPTSPAIAGNPNNIIIIYYYNYLTIHWGWFQWNDLLKVIQLTSVGFFFYRCNRGVRHPSCCEGRLGVPLNWLVKSVFNLKLRWNSVSFWLEAVTVGFLSSFNRWDRPPLEEWRKVRIPLESKQGNRPSSRDKVVNVGHISSCGRKLVILLELWQVSRGTSWIA